LGDDPCPDKRGDQGSERDAIHGQDAITPQPWRNRVFPSKNIWPLLREADLQEHDQPVNPGQVGTRSSPPATAAGTGGVMVSGGPVDR
jgi:hypothetical protein